MALKKHLDEITHRTKSYATDTLPFAAKEGFHRLIIRVPELRKLVKQGYSFYHLEPSEILLIWDHVWKNTQYYEVAHQALYYYQHKTLSKLEFSKIKTWVGRCGCWEHSDDLSKIYAQVVEDNSALILPQLRKWNNSSSPWKRRQSVVSLIEYASKRKKILPYETLISFVAPLLSDQDYYVQKGVGWTLREIHNVYPTAALEFIYANLSSLTPIAFSTATEKVNKADKTKMKEERKKLR
jgi:3-methyladenine DNA glycosylase AlkD